MIRVQVSINILLVYALLQSAFWNPSAINDGVIYPQSVVVSNGGVLYRDIQQQYGSFIPMLQGLILKLLGFELWKSRMVGMIIFLATGYLLLYLLLKRLSLIKSLIVLNFYFASFSSWSSFSTDFWPGEGLVWPNYYGVFLILVTYICLLKLNTKKSFNNGVRVYLTIIGLCIFFMPMVRLEFVFPAAICILWTFHKIKKSKNDLVYFTLILLFLNTIWLFYLASNKSLSFSIEQIILPLISGNYDSLLPSLEASSRMAFVLLLQIFIITTLFFFVQKKNHSPRSQASLILIAFILFSLLGFLTYKERDVSNLIYSLTRLIFADFIGVIGQFIVISALVLICINLITYLAPRFGTFRQISMNSRTDNFGLTILSLSLIPQVIHNFSYEYFHMILPIYLIFLLDFELKFQKFNSIFPVFAFNVLFAATFSSLAIFFYANSLQTYTFSSGNLTKMKMHSFEKYSYYNWIDQNVSKYKKEKLLFACPVGLFSVHNDRYVVDSIYPMPGLTIDILDQILERVDDDSLVLDCQNEKIFKQIESSSEYSILESFRIDSDQYAYLYRQKTN